MNNITYYTELVSKSMFNDPLIKFFFPNTEKRIYLLPKLFSILVSYGFCFGNIYTLSNGNEGIAIVKLPDNKDFNAISAIRCGGLSLPFKVGLKSLRRIIHYQTYAEMIHKKFAPTPHFYLIFIAVNVHLKGMGYGGLLLNKLLSECNKHKTPCYLETQNKKNIPFYEHFGFNTVWKSIIPGTPVTHCAMIYTPK